MRRRAAWRGQKAEDRRLLMPQLVKGGKYVFGWSRVGGTGRIVIPPEAFEEYRLEESGRMIMMPGSRSSGGFALGSVRALGGTVLGLVLEACPELGRFLTPEGDVTEHKGKPYAWVDLHGGGVTVPAATLARYGISTGDSLAVVRGSGLGVSFLVRGRIVEEAREHSELEVFEPED